MKNIIILLGLPGCGKGTHAKFLSNLLNYKLISIGDLLRNYIKDNNNSLSVQIKDIMMKGEFVSSEFIVQILSEKMNQDIDVNGIILDGFPRNLEQDKILSSFISDHKIYYLYFDVSEDVVKKRIVGRYFCANCNNIYNKYYKPTKEESVCDDCGSTEFYSREDDKLNVLDLRIDQYKKDTQPLVDYYQSNCSFYRVDADCDTDHIQKKLKKLFDFVE